MRLQTKTTKDNDVYFTILSKDYHNLKVILDEGGWGRKGEDGISRVMSLLISNNDVTSLNILSDKGIDLNKRCYGGRSETPIEEAIRLGKLDMVKALLSLGVTLNMQGEGHRSALWWAVYGVRYTMMVFMLQNGSNILFDHHSLNPLNYVMKNITSANRRLIAIELISSGVDTNARDEEGRSLLHYACKQGDPLIYRMLLAVGTHPTEKDFCLKSRTLSCLYENVEMELKKPQSLLIQSSRIIRKHLSHVHNSDIRPYLNKLELPSLLLDAVSVTALYRDAKEQITAVTVE